MRDLHTYPITYKEISSCLDRLADEINKEELVGDMRPTLLKVAANMVDEHKPLKELLKQARHYVSDAGSDEDGETKTLSNELLNEIDFALLQFEPKII